MSEQEQEQVSTPVVETPVVETPVVETPVVETPVVESNTEVEPVVVDLFIGSSKVVKTEVKENDFIHYELEDGRSGFVKVDQYENMAREQAYDDQFVRVYRAQPISAKCLQVLLDYNIPLNEVDFNVKQIAQSIDDSYEKAVSKLFKRQLTDHIRVGQVDEVLKTNTELIKE